MSYSYPYPAQAHTKEEVIKAIQKKKSELQNEIAFFDAGLRKVSGLEKRGFYELTYIEDIIFFVQCWELGRDHARFRIFACNHSLEQIKAKTSLLRNGGDELSFNWQWNWETKPTDIKNAPLYVGWPFKTMHYDKLLKGKYKSLTKEV